jgi:hypothetical protein
LKKRPNENAGLWAVERTVGFLSGPSSASQIHEVLVDLDKIMLIGTNNIQTDCFNIAVTPELLANAVNKSAQSVIDNRSKEGIALHANDGYRKSLSGRRALNAPNN